MGMVKRGEIVLANFDPVIGSEQGRTRPAVIIQSNFMNKTSPVTIVATLTSRIPSKDYPTVVFLSKKDSGLSKDSIIQSNQIKTIDKSRIIKKYGILDPYTMQKVDDAIKISLGLS